MSEERLMVLTMLQEGKITSEEASKLLKALEELEMEEELELEEESYNHYKNITISSTSEEKQDNLFDKSPDTQFNHFSDKSKLEKLEKKLEKKAEKIDKWGDNFGESFGEKMESFGENFGEKMGRFGEEIAESATSITEKILKMVDGFVGDGGLNVFLGNYETVTENIDKNLSQTNYDHLEIRGLNGKIVLHSWEKESLSIKAKCSIKKSIYNKEQSIYEILEQDNKLLFKPRYSNGIGTSLEVYIPSDKFQKIYLLTTNGRIEAKELHSKELILDTTNGSIRIQEIFSDRIIASSNNGTIDINDIHSSKVELETSNAIINVKDTSCDDLVASTRNGRILVTDAQSNIVSLTSSNASIRVEDCITSHVIVKTSNSGIKISDLETSNLSKVEAYTSNSSIEISIDDNSKSYNIDAQTTMGRIDAEIPNLVYDLNKQHSPGKQKILAHSGNSNNVENQIHIIASTSNGSIKIN